MTTTPATDRTRELLARARAAEDERDQLARQVTSMQLKINRLQSGEPDHEANALLTRQLQAAHTERDTAQAELAAAREELALLTRQLKRAALVEPDPDAQRERDRGAAAVTALREANVVLARERERLLAANEALTAQVDVLQQCNATLARGEGAA